MAVIISPPRWGQTKPPSGAQLNWGHPLANSLIRLYLLNELGGGQAIDLTGRNTGSLTSGITRVGGWLHGPASGAADYVDTGAIVTNTPSQFALWAWVRTSAAATQGIWDKDGSVGGGAARSWQFRMNSTGTVQAIFFFDTSFGNIQPTSTGTINDGKWHLVGSQFNAGVGTVWIDGKQDGTASGGSTLNGSTTTARLMGTDTVETGSGSWTGDMLSAGAALRALSASEWQQLYGDPYAMVAPPARRYWAFAPVAAPGVFVFQPDPLTIHRTLRDLPITQPLHQADGLLKIPFKPPAPVFQPDPLHVSRALRDLPTVQPPHQADGLLKIPFVRAAPVFQPDGFHVLRHLRDLPSTKLIPGVDVSFVPRPAPWIPEVNPLHVLRHLRELPLTNLIPGKDVGFTAPKVDVYIPDANLYHVLRHLRELPGVHLTPGDNVSYLGPYVVQWTPDKPYLLVLYLRDDVLRPQNMDKLTPFLYINMWVPDVDPMFTLKRM